MNTNLTADIRELTRDELDAIVGAALCVKVSPSMTRCEVYVPGRSVPGAGPGTGKPPGAGPAPT
jgi:hypothetical protein